MPRKRRRRKKGSTTMKTHTSTTTTYHAPWRRFSVPQDCFSSRYPPAVSRPVRIISELVDNHNRHGRARHVDRLPARVHPSSSSVRLGMDTAIPVLTKFCFAMMMDERLELESRCDGLRVHPARQRA